MVNFMIDRRQYVISNKAKSISNRDFVESIFEDVYLLYHKDLLIQIEKDINDKNWMIIGDAYCVDVEGKRPVDDIATNASATVIKSSYTWTGRWALVGNNSIYTDATGLMGLYYFVYEDEWVISPSLHLIYELYKDYFGKCDDKAYEHYMCGSFPSPDTCLTGVKKLFPSQCIFFSSVSGLNIQYQNKYNVDNELSTEKKVTLIGQYICNAVKNINSFSDKEIKLALTCGYDSRIILAALLHENIMFEAFTMQHKTIAKADYKIPRQMSLEFGFSYTYIKRKNKIDRIRLKEYDTHSYSTIKEADREFYAYKQVDEYAENCIILKGGILDLCRCSHLPKVASAEELKNLIFTSSPNTEEYTRFKNSLKKWFDWVEDHPNKLDIRDRFNIEQHIGGWLANLQQSVEISDAVYIQVANCAAIISLILSFSEEDRKGKIIYKELYKELYPKVLEFPINPKDWNQLIRYYWNELKCNPIKSILKKVY